MRTSAVGWIQASDVLEVMMFTGPGAAHMYMHLYVYTHTHTFVYICSVKYIF